MKAIKILYKVTCFIGNVFYFKPLMFVEKMESTYHYNRSSEIVNDYIEKNEIRKLQIGTGDRNHCIEGWLNTCISGFGGAVFLDATKKFPIKDDSFDYIFSEHFIEHIKFEQAVFHLEECYRILKRGGKIRIVTPDLEALTNMHNNKNIDEIQKEYLDDTYEMWLKAGNFPKRNELLDVFTINNFFYSWGHKFIYDLKTLYYIINKCGFSEVKQCKLGSSEDKNFNGIETHHLDTSVRMNNYESIVVEAVK